MNDILFETVNAQVIIGFLIYGLIMCLGIWINFEIQYSKKNSNFIEKVLKEYTNKKFDKYLVNIETSDVENVKFLIKKGYSEIEAIECIAYYKLPDKQKKYINNNKFKKMLLSGDENQLKIAKKYKINDTI
jgi:hypothetical protein